MKTNKEFLKPGVLFVVNQELGFRLQPTVPGSRKIFYPGDTFLVVSSLENHEIVDDFFGNFLSYSFRALTKDSLQTLCFSADSSLDIGIVSYISEVT